MKDLRRIDNGVGKRLWFLGLWEESFGERYVVFTFLNKKGSKELIRCETVQSCLFSEHLRGLHGFLACMEGLLRHCVYRVADWPRPVRQNHSRRYTHPSTLLQSC